MGATGAQFRILGPVQARLDGRPVDVGPARQRGVLAVLLLAANRPVPIEALVERVWGEDRLPDRPHRAVQTYVSLLRRALAATEAAQIVRQPGGYMLSLDERLVDVHEFRATVERARAADADDQAGALFEQALGLWHGQALAALNTPWLNGVRVALERERQAAERDATDIRLRQGRHGEELPQLFAWAEAHPLDERLAGQLMLALFRSGRQAEALRLYQQVREQLAAELGADPGSALEQLHRQILTADPALAAPTPSPTAGRRGPGPTLRQLPAAPRLFTGRPRELRRLTETLAGQSTAGMSVMIAAVDGMAGVGKTALALHAAHLLAEHFPDGQLFIDLFGYTEGRTPREPADALAALLHALGVAPSSIPADVDARAALYRGWLAETRTLIVLDNAADESQVRPLLPGTAGSAVLITSRRRLKALDDTLPVPLDVLALEEAVALLRSAAGAPDEPADDELWVRTAELCGRLPLALVIAGALLRTGRRAWNLTRLIDRLARPWDGLAGYTDETRSLSAVFDLSYRSLSEHEQLLFRRLGLLPGDEVDAYAAAALLEADLHAADTLLERLADHSLLIGIAPGRYRLHDLLRIHARALAARQDPEMPREAALERLMGYYAHTAQSASRAISRHPKAEPYGPAPACAPDVAHADAAWAWLRTERASLEAAFARAADRDLGAHVVALAAGLAEILLTDGPWTHALKIHQAAVDTAEQQTQPSVAAQANALTDLGRVRYLTGNLPGARRAQAHALVIHRQIGNRVGEADAVSELGRVRLASGDHPGAARAQAHALAIYRQVGNRTGEADAVSELGQVRYLTGDYPAATDAAERALTIYRQIGNRAGEAHALDTLGRVRCATGDYAGATDAAEQALAIYRQIDVRPGEARALITLGRVRCVTGDYPAATDAAERALTICRQIGNRAGEAVALTRLGQARHHTGSLAEAAQVLARALEIFRGTGQRGNEAWALNSYAATLAAADQRTRALALYRQALAVHRELDKPDDEAVSLEGIGEHHLAAADSAQAAVHLQQSRDIYLRLCMRVDADRVQARLDHIADLSPLP